MPTTCYNPRRIVQQTIGWRSLNVRSHGVCPRRRGLPFVDRIVGRKAGPDDLLGIVSRLSPIRFRSPQSLCTARPAAVRLVRRTVTPLEDHRPKQLFSTTVGGGATTANLTHQAVERRLQSKSLRFTGLASDWVNRSCLVSVYLHGPGRLKRRTQNYHDWPAGRPGRMGLGRIISTTVAQT